jgi:hypothetical protein
MVVDASRFDAIVMRLLAKNQEVGTVIADACPGIVLINPLEHT